MSTLEQKEQLTSEKALKEIGFEDEIFNEYKLIKKFKKHSGVYKDNGKVYQDKTHVVVMEDNMGYRITVEKTFKVELPF